MAAVNDTYDIAQAFQTVEHELMESMIANLKHHRAEETKEGYNWSQWQVEQLAAVDAYRKRNTKKYKGLFRNINGSIDSLIHLQRQAGNADQETAILEAMKLGAKAIKTEQGIKGTAEFFGLNDRKINALIQSTTNDMKRAETAILRMANDKYRKVIFNAQIYATTGATYEQAVDMATKDYIAAGLNCIEYTNGARHTLSDYADMALRTAQKRAYLTGEGEMRQSWGITTVIMNKRQNPCPKCLPFTGKVLIDDVWSGGSSDGKSKITGKKYPLMSQAIQKGLYHPRCKDSHTTYFEGVSKSDEKYTKQEAEDLKEDYRAEQKQQYAKRQAGKYGRLAEFSLDEENQKKYRMKAENWEKQYQETLEKDRENGIMFSGGRITDPDSEEANNFARMYYNEIKSFSTDCRKIAKNLSKQQEDIERIKEYLFETPEFEPDAAIAQSWQRLMQGKYIKKHDRTLIEHELYEMEIKKENPGIEHMKAHKLATERYNYEKEVDEYYGNIKKNRKT